MADREIVTVADLVAEAQASADAMRQGALGVDSAFPEVSGMLIASAKIVERLCDTIMTQHHQLGGKPGGC